jgi:hypothetical protein
MPNDEIHHENIIWLDRQLGDPFERFESRSSQMIFSRWVSSFEVQSSPVWVTLCLNLKCSFGNMLIKMYFSITPTELQRQISINLILTIITDAWYQCWNKIDLKKLKNGLRDTFMSTADFNYPAAFTAKIKFIRNFNVLFMPH